MLRKNDITIFWKRHIEPTIFVLSGCSHALLIGNGGNEPLTLLVSVHQVILFLPLSHCFLGFFCRCRTIG